MLETIETFERCVDRRELCLPTLVHLIVELTLCFLEKFHSEKYNFSSSLQMNKKTFEEEEHKIPFDYFV